MPHQTEPNANNALGDLLRGMMPGCEVRSENTQTFPDHPGRHADVLITAPGRSPVAVEAEYEPAPEAEEDAHARLGLTVAGALRTIEAAIAVRYPEAVEDAYDVRQALAEARLAYCVLYEDGSRFPESGWLNGSASDLADLVRLVSVPQKAVDEAAAVLEHGIGQAASVLDDLAQQRPAIITAIARLLGMSNVPQTRRMACAIVANAMVFHERIAGMHESVKPLGLVFGPGVGNPQAEVVEAWAAILKINYWPIFAIAKDILEQLPPDSAAQVLRGLRDTAQTVNATGVDNAHNLTGRIFQRLIADRKYLATFYTLPASAALLARLAVAKMDGVDWSDAEAIGRLRVADFACGTGALLSAVYEQIAARHERAGGNPAELHRSMMEEVLYGCDVMPSAIHITGSTLSGMEPSVGFENSRLYTMPYGRQGDGTVKIGSLELLQASTALTLFNTSDPAMRTGSAGEETAAQITAEMPDKGFDLVIMNPPFTSNTAKEGSHIGTFAPAFAAFMSKDEDQREMSKHLNRLKEGTCYHGHAGMASAFAAMAHRKLKPGGTLALVLPLTASAASSWQSFRQMMAKDFTDLMVLSIAANGREMSFSSDTGMAECLVIARKMLTGASPVSAQPTFGNQEQPRGHQGYPYVRRTYFTSLRHRPRGFADAAQIAKGIVSGDYIRQIEDGPYGGTPLMVGEEFTGETIIAPCHLDGEPWGAVRLSDYSLAQTAYALSDSRLWLPGNHSPLNLKVAQLADIGSLGLYDLDITGQPPQGPFTRMAYFATATYPSLWNHDAQNETRIVCEPDSQLQVRQGMEAKAATVWNTASRAHINRDFTFGSQPLAVAFTDQDSVGGRVWPNVIFGDKRFDYAFTVWGNSTLGLLSYWWHSSRQQSSKASMSIRSGDSLPVLDFRALTDEQLLMAESIFNEFRDKELKPAYLADADANRALLDRRVIRDLLGFDEDIYQGVRRLAAKWCAEPSVHGGKPRPPGSDLVS